MNDTMVKSKPVLIFFLLVLCCLIVLPGLVSADQLIPTITKVYVEKNGEPVNDAIKLSMDCYGYLCGRYDCGGPEDYRAPGSYEPEIVFSFSATCSGYGCPIYEPYYINSRHIDYCDLNGTTGTGQFSIANFSTTPIPNCSYIHQFDFYRGDGEYYRATPEYDACLNATRSEKGMCNRYLEPITREQEQNLSWRKGIIDTGNFDDTIVNYTDAYQNCMKTYDSKRIACDRYLREINRSEMILDLLGDPVQRTCDIRIDLPSTMGTSNESVISPGNSLNEFICFLKQIFGVTCQDAR